MIVRFVSELIQPRYLSSPPVTGMASSSGTLYGCRVAKARCSASMHADLVLSMTTTSCSSAIWFSHLYRERAPGRIVPHAMRRFSSSARTSDTASSFVASVVRTTTASVCANCGGAEGERRFGAHQCKPECAFFLGDFGAITRFDHMGAWSAFLWRRPIESAPYVGGSDLLIAACFRIQE